MSALAQIGGLAECNGWWIFVGSSARLRDDGNNEFRMSIVDIDVFDVSFYCSGKVGRPRALQPQQYARVSETS